MKLVDVKQGTPEWMALRNNKIGASDAPIIMGMSPWTTPFQLWQIKMGLIQIPDNAAMKRGRDLEEQARQKFIDVTGYEVFPAVALHDSLDFMMASYDGLSKCKKIILEIKCPGKEDHEMAMDGVIPPKYTYQLQQQMEVDEIIDSAFYLSYKSEESYKILQIEKDESLINNLIPKEKAFFECMQNLEAPELIDRDYIKREDEEWTQLAKEWIELSKVEDRKEQVRKRLLEISGKMNSMGAGIKLSKIPRKGSVDYKSIPELNGLDLEKYRKPSIETFRIGVC